MNDSRPIPGIRNQRRAPSDGTAEVPLRFQGIVESDADHKLVAEDPFGRNNTYPIEPSFDSGSRDWNATSRQVWQVSRLAAVFIFFAIVVGWPLGDYLAFMKTAAPAQTWSPFLSFPAGALMLAVIAPVLILLCGYFLSHTMTMMNAAESIASAARQFIQPEESATQNVKIVGSAVRGQMDALNIGLDGALTRLASVEAMIRQHVEAIEIAGAAIESRAVGAVERVASERSRLMELTESLNAHADSFAAAIAEKAQASIETLQSADSLSMRAETEFDDRLTRLEAAAQRALNSFDTLKNALRGADETVRASSIALETSAHQSREASQQATEAAEAAIRASDEAKQASKIAIESTARETERIADAAIEATSREAAKISDATGKAIEEVKRSTASVVASAAEDATKATRAAEFVTHAARKASDAAARASAEVDEANLLAQEQATEAADRIEKRGAALLKARQALENENARLESLIDEQRQRADRLAGAIATQTGRLSKLAETQQREKIASEKPADRQTSSEQGKSAKFDASNVQSQESVKHTPIANKPPSSHRKSKKQDSAPVKDNDVLDLTTSNRAHADEGDKVRENRKKPNPDQDVQSEISRLDVLARDIAERRKRSRQEPPLSASKSDPKKAPPSRDKQNISWREILDAAEDAEPLDLAGASKSKPVKSTHESAAADAIQIIGKLQNFTLDLETRLYGAPPPALRERFDTGDRNVFANRLLRLNEADVKRRIRTESSRDKTFDHGIHEFLQRFENLLEDATTSETVDEDLEEYLSSPLGRVYLLIGATVGYFA